MDYTDKRILDIIVSAEREAGELILQAHGILAECKTGQRDVVTQYDRRVQELLTQRLAAQIPQARFFCEENEQRDELSAERLFIIDPIDGTMNFVRGFHHSCISIAYAERGTVCAGAVYNPYVGELFTAVRGEGARLNGRALHVSPAPLSDSIVCCGTAPYRPDLADESFRLMKAAFLASLDIRREGTAALDLCSVAAGRAGLFIELNLSLWDYAAGMLIVEEAGGVCRTADGAPLPLDGGKSSVFAGSPQALTEFMRIAGRRE